MIRELTENVVSDATVRDDIPSTELAGYAIHALDAAGHAPSDLADTQNLEWSSIPVTTFNSEPSTSNTPPMTSICHNSIDRVRSHRL